MAYVNVFEEDVVQSYNFAPDISFGGAEGKAIGESVDLAHEIYNRVFRKVPEQVKGR